MNKYIKTIAILTGSLFLITACNSNTEKNQENMKTDKNQLDVIFPKGEKGSADFFTGNAYNIGLVAPDTTFTTAVGNVYFEPGARSNWHSHPAGQILIITDGVGYHQIEGQPIEVIKKGDVVKCPPNVRHWHGASPDVGLQQLYIVPNTEKGIVDWQEAVTDEQYKKE
ncbi:cupin domain-containing protein [Tenacibaculum sp. 47A_GOM-205m]|uniref:cupin domain-containing protein n=1 Tax=Tenacibaculum sp. 47A_GOM-205m TaxID=1380384 RepID=UPI0004BCB511|nr:cupin domain-containing protein [Tenacibaculum sp. 47A_GOM-205m]